MKRYPIVFSIAGSDSKGGAGIQADIKTISALGAYAATAVTAIIDQTSTKVRTTYPIPNEIIEHQIKSVMEDLWPDVVKIGLIGDIDAARTIADSLRKYHPEYVVYDPVMISLDGVRVLDDETIKVINDELFPYTNLISLNLHEATLMTGIQINNKEDLRYAAKKLSEKCRIPIFLKGSNMLDNQTYDVLYIPDGESWEYIAPKLENVNVYGASCTFTSGIATYLALGYELNIAVMKAREFMYEAIERGKGIVIGHEAAPICHSWNPVKMQVYGESPK